MKQARTGGYAASSAPHRIASHRIASHRVAPLATVRHARALQRRSNAARRSRECGVEGTKAQQGRAAIHQQDHPCRELFTSLRRTRRPARGNEALERRVGVYVRVCICPRGDAMGGGEGEGVYGMLRAKSRTEKGGGIFSSKSPTREKNTSACGRSLSPEANAPIKMYMCIYSHLHHMPSSSRQPSHAATLDMFGRETLTTATRRGKT